MELPLKRLIDERFIRKKSGTCIVYIQYQYTTVKRTLLKQQNRLKFIPTGTRYLSTGFPISK